MSEMQYRELENEAVRRIMSDKTDAKWMALVNRISKAVNCLPDITATGNEHIAIKVEKMALDLQAMTSRAETAEQALLANAHNEARIHGELNAEIRKLRGELHTMESRVIESERKWCELACKDCALVGSLQMKVEKRDEDVAFLVNRSAMAGSCSFDESQRDTGMSSNSIVAIAYGAKTLKQQYMPSDMSDLMACRRMWSKLPDHRKTDDAKEAMQRAEKAVKQ
jgi:hypothetical protein